MSRNVEAALVINGIEYLSVVKAAELVNLSAATLRRYLSGSAQPQLAARKLLGAWLIEKPDLDGWLVVYNQSRKKPGRKRRAVVE